MSGRWRRRTRGSSARARSHGAHRPPRCMAPTSTRSAVAARAPLAESQGFLDVRIAIDAYELSGRQTGVGRYLTSLLAAWSSLPEAAEHEFVLFARSEMNWHVGHLRTSVHVGFADGTRWQQIVLPGMLRDAKPDVLFAPAYQSPLLTRLPTVL